MDCVIVEIIRNSWGRGYSFEFAGSRLSCAYYGYSKKEAVNRFRREFGLIGKHIDVLVFDGFKKLYSGSFSGWLK